MEVYTKSDFTLSPMRLINQLFMLLIYTLMGLVIVINLTAFYLPTVSSGINYIVSLNYTSVISVI